MSKGKNPQMGSVKVAKGGIVDVLARVEQGLNERLNSLQFAMEATRRDVIDLQQRMGGPRVTDPAAAGTSEMCTPTKDQWPRLLRPDELVSSFGGDGGGVAMGVPIDDMHEVTSRVIARINGRPVVVIVDVESGYRREIGKRRLAKVTVKELEEWPVP